MGTFLIDGRLYAFMVNNGAANLGRHRDTVNKLNVFPIPDGDTGDNMFLTIRSGAVAAGEGGEELGETSKKISGGMLPGAHGNSGVILSRIFYGIAAGLAGASSVNVEQFAAAMKRGVEEAYRAVDDPVEGTILTVYRDAVEKANRVAGPGAGFEEYFEAFVEEAKRSLERTPDLLAMLKEAGVVDSGGAGLLYIAEGMQDAILGKKIEYAQGVPETAPVLDFSAFDENSVLEFGYCTEFILRLTRSKINPDTFDEKELFDWLRANGESVVCFRDGTLVKVHVHTFTPGDVLSHVQRYGEFLSVKVENMSLQHNENFEGGNPDSSEEDEGVRLRLDTRKKAGIVTVANGRGIREMFESLGCDAVIEGGQSMNPSAGDFIDAFRKINADVIYVFPNNSNIILAAKQAAELYRGSNIVVIPSKTVGEGYAAVSMLEFGECAPDEILAQAEEIMSSVDTGFVSRASRDASGEVEVKTGDYIGFHGKNILCDNPSRADAAKLLLDGMDAGSRDVVIILRGVDAPEDECEAIAAELSKKYPRTEIIPTFGGQPVHDYVFVLE
ncbi:MAG: DAK2 domain-containing protein [Clostridia bacterium]|nr:DAK2 domain-containing protein [Clostridia bacterium]